MYTLLFCATVIALASAATVTTTVANSNVKPFPGKGDRSQNFVEYRFLNLLSNVGNAVFDEDRDESFSVGEVEVFFEVSGETDQEVTFSGGSDGISNYETVTLSEDEVGSFTVSVRNTPADSMDTATVLATCNTPIDGLRKTIILTQQVDPITESDTCTTTSGSSSCTRQVGARVDIDCQIVSESLTPVRNCDTLPADFLEFHDSTCPLRLLRTDTIDGVDAAETVSRQISSTETLAYTSSYALESTSAVYPAGDNDVRRYSTIVTGSVEADVEELKTGYLNVLNAAYIEVDDDDDANTPTTKLGSVFVVVCQDSNCDNVIDGKSVSQGSYFNWIELNSETYRVEVYSNGVTLSNFRDAGVNPLTTTQIDINDRQFYVLAVRTGGTNGRNPTLKEFNVTPPVKGTDGVAVTRVINLVDTPFVLAKPDADCCNRLSASFAVESEIDVSSADLVGTSYNAYDSFTTCGTQGDVIGTVTFPNAPATGCAFNVIFVLGQTITQETDFCSVGSVPTCNSSPQTSSGSIVTQLTFDRDDTGNKNASPGFSSQPTTLEMPVCTCDETSADCTVCDADEFEALNSNIAAIAQSVASSVSSLRSSQTSNTNSINAAITATSNNVIAVLGNDLEDVEELVEDVEELVEDVEDEAGDAVDAAEDAEKAAKKATSQAKAGKNLVKEVLAVIPTPPPVVVP